MVREDPKTKGLLFAGTERETYVSFDDGDHWQSLRLNMPASSIRDLIIHEDDLIVATHGRGFWIPDDITPLRLLNDKVASSAAFLFKPQTAVRVRWNMNSDTPLPPDEPASPNPPDGAILDYYLGPDTSGAVTLEILDGAGVLVRRYASTDPEDPIDPNLPFLPTGWCALRIARRPLRACTDLVGLHHTPLAVGRRTRRRPTTSSAAVVHDTPPTITSIWVAPGRYTVKLTANGQSYTQPLILKLDPRVKTPALSLQQQSTLSRQLYDETLAVQKALVELRALRAQIRDIKAQGATAETLAAFDKQAAAIEGGGGGGRGGRGGGGGGRGAIEAGPETFSSAVGSLTTLMRQLEAAEVAPTTQLSAAIADRRAEVAKLMAKWTALKTTGLAQVNAQLKTANLAQLSVK